MWGGEKSQRLLPFEVNSSIPKLQFSTLACPDPHDCAALAIRLLPQTLITILHPGSQYNLIPMFF